jgi:hypothetical protein
MHVIFKTLPAQRTYDGSLPRGTNFTVSPGSHLCVSKKHADIAIDLITLVITY